MLVIVGNDFKAKLCTPTRELAKHRSKTTSNKTRRHQAIHFSPNNFQVEFDRVAVRIDESNGSLAVAGACLDQLVRVEDVAGLADVEGHLRVAVVKEVFDVGN